MDGACAEVVDTGVADTGDAIAPIPDVVSPDVEAETDTTDGTTPDPGETGSPCETDVDCDSGYCINTADGSLCTELCGGDCPFDWECQLLTNSANDVVELCVPPQQILCRSCVADIDCGGTENLCLEQNDGEFCATFCEAAEDCPEGYACDPVTTSAGEETRQCVPLLGVCGDCVDLDDDGYGVGPGCDGLDCDELNPQAYSGATELCDSVDNDCDEAVDEDFDLSSDGRNCGVCGNNVHGRGSRDGLRRGHVRDYGVPAGSLRPERRVCGRLRVPVYSEPAFAGDRALQHHR